MKVLRFLVGAMVFMLFNPFYASGTNTITSDTSGAGARSVTTITLSSIDSDWTWTDFFTGDEHKAGVPLVSIQFVPAAASDRCIIEGGAVGGPEIFDKTAADATDMPQYLYMGIVMQPVLDFSDGIYTAGSKVIMIFMPYLK